MRLAYRRQCLLERRACAHGAVAHTGTAATAQRVRVPVRSLVQGADGPAATAGIRPGDLLLAVNGKPVSSPDEVRARLSGSSRAAALLIQRGGERIFVPVPIA